MLNVVYVAPFPMSATMKFARALSDLHHVRLFGIFQKPPAETQLFHHILKIDNVLDAALIERKVRQIQETYGAVHRVLGVLENIQEQLAVVRERLNIYGMKPPAAHLFRDKSAMKEALRKAGVPCARYAEVSSAQEGFQFVKRVGYPIILKPKSGAGCKATYRVNTDAELLKALSEIPVRPVLAEEFLIGREYSMEAFTVDGQPRFASFSRYYPSPLEVMENPHLQWVVLFPRQLEDIVYQRAKSIGYKAIRALGFQEGMTHMEWFCRPDGSVAVGEIGARPPGAQISEVTGLIHGFSTHQVWAEVMVFGRLKIPHERKTAAAIVFLRGAGRGRVKKIHGLSEAQAKMGGFVVDVRLPLTGAPRSSSYEGDGWVVIQHSDTDVVKKAAWELITTIRVEYETRP